MKKPNLKTAALFSAILFPAMAAAIAVPKLITSKRQNGWHRMD